MKLIDKQLLDEVSRQAKKSPRLRMNYNFHQSLEEKCHRFLNAVDPGSRSKLRWNQGNTELRNHGEARRAELRTYGIHELRDLRSVAA